MDRLGRNDKLHIGCPLAFENTRYKCGQKLFLGSDLLKCLELKHLEDLYDKYKNDPGAFKKTKDGYIIMEIEGDGGGGSIDKIAIVDSSVYLMMRVLRLYEMPDDVYDREHVKNAIICGEETDGRIHSELGVNIYTLYQRK